jgi:hypothetical protein
VAHSSIFLDHHSDFLSSESNRELFDLKDANPQMEIKSDLDPRFPVELERTIFEVAALSRLAGIPNLMLVAARVKAWYVFRTYSATIFCQY